MRLTGEVEANCLAQGAQRRFHSVSVHRTHNLPIERWTLPLSYRRASEIFVANA